MEFPKIGNHCSEPTCNRLDFLPMKCDACSNVFCIDHFQYIQHSCNEAYQKDVQVPVCPLCNKPVPSKRGEQPDIAVGQHIDRDCQADPAISKRKIYTNKCSVKGCKQKEVIQLTCDVCRRNYCLKHRHPSDHKCSEHSVTPSQAAGAAAISRTQNIVKQRKLPSWLSIQNSAACSMDRVQAPRAQPQPPTSCFQAGLSEDEALALALEKSMIDTKPRSVQEEEDRLLAQRLANCDQNYTSQRPNREKNCRVS